MSCQALIFSWFILSILISGCSDEDIVSNTEVIQELGTVLPVDVAAKQTITSVLEERDMLDRRLDNEPSLACELSYNATAIAVKTQQTANQPPGIPAIELAHHDVFLKDCIGLPRSVQKCLVDQYAFKHIESCQQARMAYDRSR